MTLLPKNNELPAEALKPAEGNQLFPVFLKLNDLHTVLVGAGNIGLEKLNAVMNNSPRARVTVIAKEVLPEVHVLAEKFDRVKIIQQAFADTDLDNADLVIAATGNPELNDYIRQSARDRKLLVNIADKPNLCDFYLASIVQKGDLKIAISTNGKSPTVAKRIKEVLNEGIPIEIDTTLQHVNQLRDRLNGDFSDKIKQLNKLTAVLVSSNPKVSGIAVKNLKWLIWGAIVLFILVAGTTLWYKDPVVHDYINNINPIFYYFLGAGFVFAMIDGAIGMSYGVTTTSFSIAMGIPPASASMGVHLSEIMSNGIAGWMHYRLNNINWKLFRLLVVPGIIGAMMGAYLLSSLEHYSTYTKPVVSLYTFILALVIFKKAYQITRKKSANKIKKIRFLGFGGGFVDAVGGGGWGSIVLSALIAGGRNPRFSLGTVKLSRFFIALMSSLTFVTMLNGIRWEAVSGLIIGSALASPIAAKVSNRISTKAIMVAVGVIVMLTSLRSIALFLLKVI
jgi:siroheme synthase-like protein